MLNQGVDEPFGGVTRKACAVRRRSTVFPMLNVLRRILGIPCAQHRLRGKQRMVWTWSALEPEMWLRSCHMGLLQDLSRPTQTHKQGCNSGCVHSIANHASALCVGQGNTAWPGRLKALHLRVWRCVGMYDRCTCRFSNMLTSRVAVTRKHRLYVGTTFCIGRHAQAN